MQMRLSNEKNNIPRRLMRHLRCEGEITTRSTCIKCAYFIACDLCLSYELVKLNTNQYKVC